jgi:hypothetical protein
MNTAMYDTDQLTHSFDAQGNAIMLLHEDLARARMRESQRVAAQARLARRLGTVRRWRRLAEWASRHAIRAAAEV